MGNLLEESSFGVHRDLTRYCDRDLDKAREEATLEALSKMNNNRKYSDLVIVCKNGVRKYGSRLWLSARCAKLERIIMNEICTTTQSGLAVISLPNIGPGAMLIVLEYLHTGSPGAFLQHLGSKTIRRLAHDVINAAKELHLPRLENIFCLILDTGVSRLELASQCDEEENERREIFEALSRMLKSPRYSDVLIHSSDGVLIPASCLWLAARCPVLGRMFTRSRHKESNVRVPTFEQKVSLNLRSEVVHIVLEYLYMGSPRIHMQRMNPKKRWIAGFEAICAARYLEVPQLEEFLRSLLIEDVCKSTSDPTHIELSVFRLSELRNFRFESLSGRIIKPDDHSRYVNRLATELVRMIERGWMDTDHIRQLSRKDFIFFLKKTRRERKNHEGDGYKLEEYHRVRGIIKWCVWEYSWSTDVPPEMAIKLVSIFFTTAEFAEPLHFDDCTGTQREISYELLYRERRRIAQAHTTRKILKRICKLAKFEQFFLPFVDLDLVHPALLTNLLKPWGLISSSLIHRALEKQVLRTRQL